MTKPKKFAELRKKNTAEVLCQMFSPGYEEDALSAGLRILTHQLQLCDPEAKTFGFGGAFGYGVDFENDVFLMHPYCWCEKSGECPWCTGCGHYESCMPCSSDPVHAKDCYQTELHNTLDKWELKNPEPAGANTTWSKWLKRKQVLETRLLTRLMSKYDKPAFGSFIHCTCGATEEKAKQRDKQGCDYHKGTGIFTRFSPWTVNKERNYFDPPHFWHKSSDFRVTWYKYIGRDNATNREISMPEWKHLMESALASIQAPPLEKAIKAFELASKESEENFKSSMKALSDVMIESFKW